MSLVVDEHRQYLDDRPRLAAFEAALNAVVSPGDVVLDLASGTGILGLLACRAGASRVYAIESEAIASLARPFARENGVDDRVTLIQELASRATLPEQVDVIVTDLAGRFGFEAGLIEVLGDARRRFLKPGGRLIPSSVTLFVAPVRAGGMRQEIDFWTQPVSGLSFRAAHPLALSTGYPRHLDPADLLAPGSALTTVDLHQDCDTLSGRAEFVVACDGALDAVGGWFSATLAPGVALTNAPDAADRINRRNVLFPLRSTVDARTGDRVAVSMFIRPADLLVRWRVSVTRGGAAIHATDSSTLGGMLVSADVIHRLQPSATPALTRAGEARRTVLELCDGARPVADIERLVFERHRDLFSRPADAAEFVAEVLARYAV